MKDLVQSILMLPKKVFKVPKKLSSSTSLLPLIFSLSINFGAIAQAPLTESGFQPDPSEAAGIIIISGKQYYGELGINTMLDFNFQSTPALSLGIGGSYRLRESETLIGWESVVSNTFLGRGTALCVPSGCPECGGPNPPRICQYLDESFQSTTTISVKAVLTRVGKHYTSELRFGSGYQFDAGKNVRNESSIASIANSNSFTINYGVAIGIPITKKLVASFSLDGINNLGADIMITESGANQESFRRKKLMLLSPGLKLRFLL